MKELQNKQRIRRAVYSIPSLIILLIITLLLVRGAVRVVGKDRVNSGRTTDLEARAATLVLREKELKDSIAKLQTEEGIKNEIKEKFSVSGEGEYVAVIVDEKKASSSEVEAPLPWYKAFWNAIIGGK